MVLHPGLVCFRVGTILGWYDPGLVVLIMGNKRTFLPLILGQK